MTHDSIINLWPDGCPHNDQPDDAMVAGRPALRHFKAPEVRLPQKPRAAIIVCPGGGYGFRARHEGDPFSALFNLHGIEAFVLDYRVAPHRFPSSYTDACRAIRLLRSRAEEFNIDTNRIGIIGFSAGGHLAATVATQPDLHHDEHDDLVSQFSARPDRVILGYPVISSAEDVAHSGSFENLLGPRTEGDKAHEALRKQLSNELHVTSDAPPAFLFHTASDAGVPPQNSLLYAMAFANAGVKCETHIFEQGAHGQGMAIHNPSLRPWSQLMITWLENWLMSLN